MIPIDSIICLFFRNSNCSGKIYLSRNGFNLRAIILVKSLYTKLHNEMGLKSVKVTGFSFLGIKEIKVELREDSTLPEVLEYYTAARKSPPIR